MKKIKIGYIDFWPNFKPEDFIFTQILQKHFEIEITSDNPDFIFCSNQSRNYLQYKCPRIYYTGEAVAPDFNVYDYAIGFDNLTFGDRYLRYPFCLMNRDMVEKAMHKHETPKETLLSKKNFCSYVVTADGGVDNRRDILFDEISEYKQVTSGGRHRNNLPDGKPVPDKLEFQKDFKFCLTCENSAFKGYTTEKIIDAFAAKSIPIYWGDPDIARYFNKKAFIDVSDYDNDEDLVSVIKHLNENDDEYLSMLSEPIITDDSELIPMMQDSYLEDFLMSIFSQTPVDALRRNSAYARNGKFHEHDLYRLERIDSNKLISRAKDIKRKLFGNKKL